MDLFHLLELRRPELHESLTSVSPKRRTFAVLRLAAGLQGEVEFGTAQFPQSHWQKLDSDPPSAHF